MTKIISINGYKRSGKGETGDAVARNWPAGPVLLNGFAHKMKVFAALSLGFSRDRSDEELIALMDKAKEHWIIDVTNQDTPDNVNAKRPEGPFHDLTGREYLQHVGTRARQMFGDDFWVDQVLPQPGYAVPGYPHSASNMTQTRLAARYPGTDLVVFTDLRFENEAQRTLDLGGETWRVNRPGTESDGHDSEQRLPDALITREIDNSGTLDDLDERVAVELANMAAGYQRA